MSPQERTSTIYAITGLRTLEDAKIMITSGSRDVYDGILVEEGRGMKLTGSSMDTLPCDARRVPVWNGR
jgi:hypothetical protein